MGLRDDKGWLLLLPFFMAIAGSMEVDHSISIQGGHLLLCKDQNPKQEKEKEEEEEEESTAVVDCSFSSSFSSTFSSSVAVAGVRLRPLSFGGGGDEQEELEQSMDPLWEQQQQEEKLGSPIRGRDHLRVLSEDEILVSKIYRYIHSHSQSQSQSHRPCRKRSRSTLREFAMASDDSGDNDKEKRLDPMTAGLKKLAKKKNKRFKPPPPADKQQRRVFDCEIKIAFSRFIPKSGTKVVVHRMYTSIKECFHLSKVKA